MNYEILMLVPSKVGQKNLCPNKGQVRGFHFQITIFVSHSCSNILNKDEQIKGAVNQSFIYHYDSMDFEVWLPSDGV